MAHNTNHYTLPDLVDLALGGPGSEPGAVNFNLLHAVLKSMVKELGFEKIRPWVSFESAQLAQAGLVRSVLQGRKPPAKPPKPKKGAPKAPDESQQEDASPPEEESSGAEPPPQDLKERREDAAWDDIVTDIKVAKKGQPAEKKPGKVGDAWKYTQLRTKVDSNEENIMRLNEIVSSLVRKMAKGGLGGKKGGKGGGAGGPGGSGGGGGIIGEDGVEYGYGEGIDDDEDDDDGILDALGPDAPSMADFDSLEERVVSLEESREIFEVDHEKLEVALRQQEKTIRDVEKLKDISGKIEKMEEDIASKADQKEMEAELAKKGDLELVNTKVDQLEFETAIEELGESIGRLGLKFQKKMDAWEDQNAALKTAIEGKMSRDVFDKAIAKVESRMTAITHNLMQIKKLVDEVLNPDAGGITRCMSCKRPAKESGREYLDEVAMKRPLKVTESSSNESTDMKGTPKLLRKVSTKRPRLEGPPYPDKKEYKIGLPSASISGIGPIDEVKESVSSVPKLPDIHAKTSQSEEKKKKPITIRVALPKISIDDTVNDPLFFTKLRMEKLEREAERKKKLLGLEDDGPAPDTLLDSTSDSSKNSYQKASSASISSEAAKSLKVFVPTQYMKDPSRRGGLQKSSSNT